MTQFYKLLGAMTVNRPNLYYRILASDYGSNDTTIRIENNKEVSLEYGLGLEDFGEIAIQREGQDDEEEDEEDEEAMDQRISDVFEVPVPDMETSLIGP